MIAISVDSPGKLTIRPDTTTRPKGDEVLVRFAVPTFKFCKAAIRLRIIRAL